MLSLVFVILLFVIFGKLFGVAFKAAWGITKTVVTVVLLPLALVGLVLAGLIYVALPVLIIIGIVSAISYR